MLAAAIRHAIAATDFVRAAGLIEQVWPAMRKRQQEATVLGWLQALPDPLIRDRPILSLIYALVLLNSGQIGAVEARLQDAEQGLAQFEAAVPGHLSPAQAAQQLGISAARYQSLPAAIVNARAYRAQALGDVASTITYAQQALALLPIADEYERGTTAAILGLAYWASGNAEAAHRSFAEGLHAFQTLGGIQITISATFILANMQMAQGLLPTAITTCERALQLAAQPPGPIMLGTAELYLALSELHYEQGDLAAARQLLQKGESLREQMAISGADYMWWLIKAQLTAAQGDLDTALEQLPEAAHLYRRSPVPDVRPIEALKVRWWLRQGQLTKALNWFKERGLSVDDEPSYLREYEHLTLARVTMAQRHSERSIAQYSHHGIDDPIHPILDLLTRLLNAAAAQNRTGSTVKILVVLALAYDALGEIEAAIAPLERALTLAEPKGYVRIFAECGPPMATLLQEAMTRNITPTYTQQLLTAIETWGQNPNSPTPQLPNSPTPQLPNFPAPQLLHPSSNPSVNENSTSSACSTPKSGPEIARELVVALSTVRTHTKRIYSKLNVTNRRAAVKRATELGLI
ncbi:MAG: tetratricopeptide repeat protein [Cyanobacteria bacterium P01_F01_bin.56]